MNNTCELVDMSGVECYSPSDVIKILGISRAATYKLFNTKGFPSFSAGERCLRITKSDFKRWQEEQKKNKEEKYK
ncbi:MAG: helix-turn-helix protein [Clostridia bacterium]|jgi:predicted DNA-binding transcriptional regulator AlpA|nr:helix-turn-helix protein [Clostridia bacterium]